MTRRTPPRFATWLLRRFAFGPHAQSLIGDIVEQYQRGRSATWYSHQVLATVFVGAVAFIRAHPRSTLRLPALVVTVLWCLSPFAWWWSMSGSTGPSWLNLSINLAVLGYCSVGFILLILTITSPDEPRSLLLAEFANVALSCRGAAQERRSE